MIAGVVILCLGAAAPAIVRKALDDALRRQSTIPNDGGQGHWSEKRYSNWVDSWVDRDYYLFNYTNVRAALLNGTKLNVHEVGPVKFREYTHRFDMNYDEVNGTNIVDYIDWGENRYRDDVTQPYTMHETLTQVNTMWFIVTGLAGSEENLRISLAAGAVNSFNTTFNNDFTGTMLTALKFLSYRQYILTMPGYLNGATGETQFGTGSVGGYTSVLLRQWINGTIPNGTSWTLKARFPATYTSGFELTSDAGLVPNGGGATYGQLWAINQLSIAQAESLWDNTVATSLTSSTSTGITGWLAVCNTCPTTVSTSCSSTTVSAIRGAYESIITSNQISLVCAHISNMYSATLSYKPDYTARNMQLYSAGLNIQDCNGWAQVGSFQFANSTAFGYAVASSALSFSMTKSLQASTHAIEYGFWTKGSYSTTNIAGSSAGHTLTQAQTAKFFEVWKNSTHLGRFFGTVQLVLRTYYSAKIVTPEYTTAGLDSADLTTLGARVCGGAAAFGAAELVFWKEAGIGDSCEWTLSFYHYLWHNVGERIMFDDNIRGSTADMTIWGTGATSTLGLVSAECQAKTASGMFARLTMLDSLNGYTDALSCATGAPAYSGIVDIISYNSSHLNVSYYKEKSREEHNPYQRSARMTGFNRWKDSNYYYAYDGVRHFRTMGELFLEDCTPSRQCADTDPAWNTTEYIQGYGDGTKTIPWRDEDHDGRLDAFQMWFSEAFRRVPMVHSATNDIKDIPTEMYIPDDGLFGNPASSFWWGYEWFSSGYPQGIVNIATVKFDVPVVLSIPHFSSNYDESVSKLVTGLQWSETEYRTKLYIEPWSGLTISGEKHMQTAYKISSSTTTSPYYKNLFTRNSTLYLPFYYATDYKTIDDEDADAFKTNIIGTRAAAAGIQIAFPILGVILMGVAVYLWMTSGGATFEQNKSNMGGSTNAGVQMGSSTVGGSNTGL